MNVALAVAYEYMHILEAMQSIKVLIIMIITISERRWLKNAYADALNAFRRDAYHTSDGNIAWSYLNSKYINAQ